jgi:hypothetical protein
MLGGSNGTPMPSNPDNARYWRERAEESRVLAKGLTDPEAKRMMRDVVETYERLARHAEARERKTPAKT